VVLRRLRERDRSRKPRASAAASTTAAAAASSAAAAAASSAARYPDVPGRIGDPGDEHLPGSAASASASPAGA